MKWDVLAPFVIYMVLVLAVALYARMRITDAVEKGGKFMDEFYVAGRSLGPFVLAFTFLATFASAGTFIGYPGFAFKNGMTVVMTGINQIAMVYVTFAIIGKRMAIIGHRTGALTFTDVLRYRFDHPLVVAGSTLAILLFFIGFMIGQFAGAARILQTVAGIPYYVGVLLFAGVVAFTVVLGGFRAVAWTDTIQGLFMLLGLILVFPAFIIFGGGFEKITMKLLEIDPARVFGPGPKGWLPPSMLISFWILWVWISIGNPATSMRFLSAKSSKSVHQGLIIGTVVATIFYVPMFYMGAGARAVFPDVAPDLAIPTIYISTLPGIIAGLALAAPFAAVMSTVDSLLLVMSGAIVRDVYQQYMNPKASPELLARLAYGVTGALGILVLVLALQPPKLIATYIIYFGGGVTAAFVVPMITALYWKRATTAGAIASIFGGFLTFLAVDIWFKNPLDIMSYLWGVLASAVLMYAVSMMTAPPPRAVVQLYYGPPPKIPPPSAEYPTVGAPAE